MYEKEINYIINDKNNNDEATKKLINKKKKQKSHLSDFKNNFKKDFNEEFNKINYSICLNSGPGVYTLCKYLNAIKKMKNGALIMSLLFVF